MLTRIEFYIITHTHVIPETVFKLFGTLLNDNARQIE